MKPFLVPLTKELLLLRTNAHQSYKNYLEKEEKQRKAAEEKIKIKAEAETAVELTPSVPLPSK